MPVPLHCGETRPAARAEQPRRRRWRAGFAALCALCVAAVALGADDPRALLRRGAALEAAGDTAGASAAYRAALGAAGPAPSAARADALLAIAALETDLGRYGDAAGRAEEAAGIARTLGDDARAATALNQLGLAALYDGDYARAERSFTDAATISARRGDAEGRAEQLSNLGNVHFYTGRYAEAGQRYAEARALAEAAPAAPWSARRRRLVLANQATLDQRLGRDVQALATYRALGDDAAGLAVEERAQLLVNLGVLYRRLGDPLKALDTYAAAEALFSRDRHVNGEIGALKNRGIVLALDLGRLAEAEGVFGRALDAATRAGDRREQLHARLYRGETRRRAGDISGARADFGVALPLARALQTPEEEWKALYGLGRTETDAAAAAARLREAVAVVEGLREGIRVPSLRSDFLADKREVYDALIGVELPRGDPAALFALIERSHSRVWRDRLGLPAAPDLQAVQHALPRGTLLLDYWFSRDGAALVSVSRDAAQVRPVAVTAAEVAALADRLAAPPTAERPAGDDWADLAARVGAVLLPPASWLDGVEHVIVVADGPLALVPFEALSSGGALLVERAAVSYTPTAATLLRAGAPPRGLRAPWGRLLRAFGDPRFEVADLDDGRAAPGRLGASAGEVRGIASELGGRAELHLGPDNRKEHLTAPGTPVPLIHLATHAVADASALERSRLVFSGREGGGPAEYLFLREAYELPLAGVDLVVLSACETARGRLVRGEGVQSFSRAFLAAGARSAVTTLWRVPDEPTAAFMRLFYYQLQRGLPRDEALRRAKRRFLADRRGLAHPHFWAAFVLSGDALAPVPRAPRLATLVGGLALVLAAAAAVALARAGRR